LNLAGEITRQAWDEDAKVHRGLCALWKRVQANGPNEAQGAALPASVPQAQVSGSKGPDEAQTFATNLMTELGCGH
jgi:hypothetical protein